MKNFYASCKAALLVLCLLSLQLAANAQTVAVTSTQALVCPGGVLNFGFAATNWASGNQTGRYTAASTFTVHISSIGGGAPFSTPSPQNVTITNPVTFDTGNGKTQNYTGTITLPSALTAGDYRISISSSTPTFDGSLGAGQSMIFRVGIPAEPQFVQNANRIYGATTGVTVNVPVGQTVRWYDSTNTVVGTTTSYAPLPNTKVGTYKYKAEAVNGTCVSPGRTEVSLTITPKTLTIGNISIPSKTYDGLATINVLGSALLVGVVSNDNVILNASSVSATFADKNVGDNKPVSVSGFTIGGTSVANYTLQQPSGFTSTIAKKSTLLTFTASDKIVDQSTAAVINSWNLLSKLVGDDVSLNTSLSKASFATSEVGNNITVTMNEIFLSGDDANNYSVDNSSPITTVANILPIDGTLPVELTAFTAARNGGAVNLTWATASEQNNDYFVVEQSEDGKTFRSVGQKIKGAGTTVAPQSYKAAISANSNKTLYFRLKQVDFDGKFEFSNVVAVAGQSVSAKVSTLSAIPNPTTGQVVLVASEAVTGPATITLFHSSGRVVVQKQVSAEQALELDLSTQAPGVYFVQVQTATGKTTTRVIKH